MKALESKRDPGQYLAWITEKLREIRESDKHKPHADANLLQFMAIIIAVCRFKMPEEVLPINVSEHSDLARFELGLFFIATLENWSGFSISNENVDKHQVQ